MAPGASQDSWPLWLQGQQMPAACSTEPLPAGLCLGSVVVWQFPSRLVPIVPLGPSLVACQYLNDLQAADWLLWACSISICETSEAVYLQELRQLSVFDMAQKLLAGCDEQADCVRPRSPWLDQQDRPQHCQAATSDCCGSRCWPASPEQAGDTSDAPLPPKEDSCDFTDCVPLPDAEQGDQGPLYAERVTMLILLLLRLHQADQQHWPPWADLSKFSLIASEAAYLAKQWRALPYLSTQASGSNLKHC